METVQQLKEWFSRNKKPTGEQFAALIDSFRHKGENIPISGVGGLQERLDAVNTTAMDAQSTANDAMDIANDANNAVDAINTTVMDAQSTANEALEERCLGAIWLDENGAPVNVYKKTHIFIVEPLPPELGGSRPGSIFGGSENIPLLVDDNIQQFQVARSISLYHDGEICENDVCVYVDDGSLYLSTGDSQKYVIITIKYTKSYE